jgi:amino acid transporter
VWLALSRRRAVFGTLLPAVTLIVLGAHWLLAGRHIAIPFSARKPAPDLGNLNNVVFFVAVLLGYGGIEMAGFHAKETRNPARDYPRAILAAGVVIVGVAILATIAVLRCRTPRSASSPA